MIEGLTTDKRGVDYYTHNIMNIQHIDFKPITIDKVSFIHRGEGKKLFVEIELKVDDFIVPFVISYPVPDFTEDDLVLTITNDCLFNKFINAVQRTNYDIISEQLVVYRQELEKKRFYGAFVHKSKHSITTNELRKHKMRMLPINERYSLIMK